MSRAESNAADDANKMAIRNDRKRNAILIVLGILVLLMSGGALVSSFIQNNSYQSQLSTQNKKFEQQLAAQIADQQEVQRKAAEQVDIKLCSTLTGLALIKAPPGNPATNPSRAFEQAQQKKLSELSSDLGCK